MKWLLSCCLLLSVSWVHAGLPDTVGEVDIQIAYLEQQKILLKKRYQGDVVYQHRRLTYPSLSGTPKDQARVVQSNTSQHFSWLIQAQAAIDQEILDLKKHKQTLLLGTSRKPYTVMLLVPKTHVTWQQGKAFITVLTEQGRQARAVKMGSDVGGGLVQVLSGVSLGDVIQ